MEFFDVIKKRHCTRSFNSEKVVNDEDINKIVEAGMMAPTVGGLRPTHFEVVKDREVIKKLVDSTAGMAVTRPSMSFIGEASVVLVIWTDIEKVGKIYKDRGREVYAMHDAGAAIENAFLATVALGLSTCWIGAFSEEKVRKLLGLKRDERPMAMLPVGYARN